MQMLFLSLRSFRIGDALLLEVFNRNGFNLFEVFDRSAFNSFERKFHAHSYYLMRSGMELRSVLKVPLCLRHIVVESPGSGLATERALAQ